MTMVIRAFQKNWIGKPIPDLQVNADGGNRVRKKFLISGVDSIFYFMSHRLIITWVQKKGSPEKTGKPLCIFFNTKNQATAEGFSLRRKLSCHHQY